MRTDHPHAMVLPTTMYYVQTMSRDSEDSPSKSLEGANPMDPIDECLKVIRFDKEKQRKDTMNNAFTEWDNFSTLTEKDISKMADSFSKHAKAHKITFGLAHTKCFKGLMYLVQDQFRCNEEPDYTKFDLTEACNALD